MEQKVKMKTHYSCCGKPYHGEPTMGSIFCNDCAPEIEYGKEKLEELEREDEKRR
ncbi:MAG: hypothetical protein GY861_03445 [bacterium]|nr:hypothetical protein [bacterium]